MSKIKVTKVKIFGMNGNASSQGMYILNMKALPLMVQKLRQMFAFQACRSKVMVKVGRSKFFI